MVDKIIPKQPLIICLDGVVGEQVTRYKEGGKTVLLTEISSGIIEEKLASGMIKQEELVDGNLFPIRTDKFSDILDTQSNPMVLVWTDIRGNDVDFTPSMMRELSNLRNENMIMNMQVVRLQKKLAQATSDIGREVRENREIFKPIIEQIQQERPSPPSQTIKKIRSVPV